MRSYEFTQRWLAPDLGRLWEVATVLGVRLDGSDAATLRLELPRPAHFAAGQYYLVRMRVDATPKGVEQAYSVSSSPWPPSSEIEITVRDVPGGRVSPVLTRQVGAGDQLHLHGPFGTLTWSEADGGPLVMIGAGSGIAPMTSIMRLASACKSTVPMALLCSNRERASVLLYEPLEELDRHEDRVSVTHTFTRSPWDPSARYHRQIDAPMIDDVIDGLALRSPALPSVLVAGPPAMVTSVRAALATLGIGEDRIKSELHG